uniref:Uncharacterized protein n=1 Tax=Aegilops tauschii subsp. strangulata TaxID=200361 RepID=A0A453JHA4_AEGTS
ETMAASSSALILLLATALTAGASARSFSITNRCSFTVWPAATPAGGGRQLNNGETWNLDIPDGTRCARIWGRTGCTSTATAADAAPATVAARSPAPSPASPR